MKTIEEIEKVATERAISIYFPEGKDETARELGYAAMGYKSGFISGVHYGYIEFNKLLDTLKEASVWIGVQPNSENLENVLYVTNKVNTILQIYKSE